MASTNTTYAPVTVRHLTKDHVVIRPTSAYSVTTFISAQNGVIEAIVTANDGSETIRLLVAAPEPGRMVKVEKDEKTGDVDIIYKDILDAEI
jgi:hypothetical protein